MAKLLLKEAKEEVARLRALESTYTHDFPAYDGCDGDDDIGDSMIRARELSEWRFAFSKKWNNKNYEKVTSVKIMEQYPEVKEWHTLLVVQKKCVSNKDFWQRYDYWCGDEKRWIQELQRRKEAQVKNRLTLLSVNSNKNSNNKTVKRWSVPAAAAATSSSSSSSSSSSAPGGNTFTSTTTTTSAAAPVAAAAANTAAVTSTSKAAASAASPVGLGLKDRLKQWNSATTTTTTLSSSSFRNLEPTTTTTTSNVDVESLSVKKEKNQEKASVLVVAPLSRFKKKPTVHVPSDEENEDKEDEEASMMMTKPPSSGSNVTPVSVGLPDRLEQYQNAIMMTTHPALLSPSAATPPSVGVPVRLQRWSQAVAVTTPQQQLPLSVVDQQEEEPSVSPPAKLVTTESGSPLGIGLKDRLKQWDKATSGATATTTTTTAPHPPLPTTRSTGTGTGTTSSPTPTRSIRSSTVVVRVPAAPAIASNSALQDESMSSSLHANKKPEDLHASSQTTSLKDRMKAWGNASSQSFCKKKINTPIINLNNKASHDVPPASPAPIMDRKSARAESDRRRKAKETYLEPLSNTTTSSSSDAHDFCLEFRRNFNHRAQARAAQLQMFPDTVAVHYRSMVPKKVSEKEFWERYYFRCDVDRIMAEGQGGVFHKNQDHHHHHQNGNNNDTQSMVSSITHEFEPTSFESSSFHYHKKPPTSIAVPTNVPQRRTSAPVGLYGAASSTQLKTRTIPKVELHSAAVAKESSSSSSSSHKKPTAAAPEVVPSSPAKIFQSSHTNVASTSKRASLKKTIANIHDLDKKKPKEHHRQSVLPKTELQAHITEEEQPEIVIPASAIEQKAYLVSMYKSLETVTGTPTRLSIASPPPPPSSTSSAAMEQVPDQVRKQLLFDEEGEVPQEVSEDQPLAESLAQVEEVISSTTTPEDCQLIEQLAADMDDIVDNTEGDIKLIEGSSEDALSSDSSIVPKETMVEMASEVEAVAQEEITTTVAQEVAEDRPLAESLAEVEEVISSTTTPEACQLIEQMAAEKDDSVNDTEGEITMNDNSLEDNAQRGASAFQEHFENTIPSDSPIAQRETMVEMASPVEAVSLEEITTTKTITDDVAPAKESDVTGTESVVGKPEMQSDDDIPEDEKRQDLHESECPILEEGELMQSVIEAVVISEPGMHVTMSDSSGPPDVQLEIGEALSIQDNQQLMDEGLIENAKETTISVDVAIPTVQALSSDVSGNPHVEERVITAATVETTETIDLETSEDITTLIEVAPAPAQVQLTLLDDTEVDREDEATNDEERTDGTAPFAAEDALEPAQHPPVVSEVSQVDERVVIEEASIEINEPTDVEQNADDTNPLVEGQAEPAQVAPTVSEDSQVDGRLTEDATLEIAEPADAERGTEDTTPLEEGQAEPAQAQLTLFEGTQVDKQDEATDDEEDTEGIVPSVKVSYDCKVGDPVSEEGKLELAQPTDVEQDVDDTAGEAPEQAHILSTVSEDTQADERIIKGEPFKIKNADATPPPVRSQEKEVASGILSLQCQSVQISEKREGSVHDEPNGSVHSQHETITETNATSDRAKYSHDAHLEETLCEKATLIQTQDSIKEQANGQEGLDEDIEHAESDLVENVADLVEDPIVLEAQSESAPQVEPPATDPAKESAIDMILNETLSRDESYYVLAPQLSSLHGSALEEILNEQPTFETTDEGLSLPVQETTESLSNQATTCDAIIAPTAEAESLCSNVQLRQVGVELEQDPTIEFLDSDGEDEDEDSSKEVLIFENDVASSTDEGLSLPVQETTESLSNQATTGDAIIAPTAEAESLSSNVQLRQVGVEPTLEQDPTIEFLDSDGKDEDEDSSKEVLISENDVASSTDEGLSLPVQETTESLSNQATTGDAIIAPTAEAESLSSNVQLRQVGVELEQDPTIEFLDSDGEDEDEDSSKEVLIFENDVASSTDEGLSLPVQETTESLSNQATTGDAIIAPTAEAESLSSNVQLRQVGVEPTLEQDPTIEFLDSDGKDEDEDSSKEVLISENDVASSTDEGLSLPVQETTESLSNQATTGDAIIAPTAEAESLSSNVQLRQVGVELEQDPTIEFLDSDGEDEDEDSSKEVLISENDVASSTDEGLSLPVQETTESLSNQATTGDAIIAPTAEAESFSSNVQLRQVGVEPTLEQDPTIEFLDSDGKDEDEDSSKEVLISENDAAPSSPRNDSFQETERLTKESAADVEVSAPAAEFESPSNAHLPMREFDEPTLGISTASLERDPTIEFIDTDVEEDANEFPRTCNHDVAPSSPSDEQHHWEADVVKEVDNSPPIATTDTPIGDNNSKSKEPDAPLPPSSTLAVEAIKKDSSQSQLPTLDDIQNVMVVSQHKKEIEACGLGLLDRMVTSIFSSCAGDLTAVGSNDAGEIAAPSDIDQSMEQQQQQEDQQEDQQDEAQEPAMSPMSAMSSQPDDSMTLERGRGDQSFEDRADVSFDSTFSGDSTSVDGGGYSTMEQSTFSKSAADDGYSIERSTFSKSAADDGYSMEQSTFSKSAATSDDEEDWSTMSKSKARRLRRKRTQQATSQRLLSASSSKDEEVEQIKERRYHRKMSQSSISQRLLSESMTQDDETVE